MEENTANTHDSELLGIGTDPVTAKYYLSAATAFKALKTFSLCPILCTVHIFVQSLELA